MKFKIMGVSKAQYKCLLSVLDKNISYKKYKNLIGKIKIYVPHIILAY